MDDGKTIKIQKLKGALNYRIWSAEIRTNLEGKGLLNVALSNEPRPAGTSTPRARAPNRSSRSRRSRRAPTPEPSPEPALPAESKDGGSEDTPLERWKRKDIKARSLIMTHCQANMKDKIVHLETSKEMWETLKKDCRPASNVSLATYTNRFYSYEPKRDATDDSISSELQDLQSAIFMTKEEEKPTELSKTSAFLRAVCKLSTEFNTGIEILEDKLDTLDFEATVVALKETE
jgi:hypothetical protein